MKSYKVFLTFQVIVFYLFILPIVNKADAIIIIAPIIAGAAQLTALLLAALSLPVTLISAFVNLDRIKESKVKFFAFTLLTWAIILLIIGVISFLVFKVFDINIELPDSLRKLF